MESKIIKKEFSISLLLQYLERDIAGIKSQKADGLKEAEQDYDCFFRWHAETLMQNELKLKYLEQIKSQITKLTIQRKCNKDAVIDLLNYFVNDVDRQLEVHGTNIHNSTSAMSNTHNVLKIQNWFNVKEYIKDFLDYIYKSQNN